MSKESNNETANVAAELGLTPSLTKKQHMKQALQYFVETLNDGDRHAIRNSEHTIVDLFFEAVGNADRGTLFMGDKASIAGHAISAHNTIHLLRGLQNALEFGKEDNNA